MNVPVNALRVTATVARIGNLELANAPVASVIATTMGPANGAMKAGRPFAAAHGPATNDRPVMATAIGLASERLVAKVDHDTIAARARTEAFATNAALEMTVRRDRIDDLGTTERHATSAGPEMTARRGTAVVRARNAIGAPSIVAAVHLTEAANAVATGAVGAALTASGPALRITALSALPADARSRKSMRPPVALVRLVETSWPFPATRTRACSTRPFVRSFGH